jgi:hypothetical protein
MYPPIFPTIAASSAVKALIGSSPVRFYQFGLNTTQPQTLPYVVWQRVFGQPLNYLGDVPDTDDFTIQIDVYGSSAEQVRNVAVALRDAIEQPMTSYITNWLGESIDPDTKHYRFTFQNEWLVAR